MKDHAVRYGGGIAIILDADTAGKLGLEHGTPIEIEVLDHTLVVKRAEEVDSLSDAELEQIMERINEQYGELFQRLADGPT